MDVTVRGVGRRRARALLAVMPDERARDFLTLHLAPWSESGRGAADESDPTPQALARGRAATARNGAARIFRGARGWWVVSEQLESDDHWSLLADTPDGTRRVREYPAAWMLLSEPELRRLVGAS